jgi:hypothetical protein
MSRFLYIDSKGKEVPIPSVDALALRIELGAVKEDTQFYDSAADRWAPAGEHEVFRSLQREKADKSAGFVAPPPPSLPPPPVPQPPAAKAPPPAAKEPAPNPFESIEGPAAGKPAETHDVFGGMDLGLTFEEVAPAEEAPPVAPVDPSFSAKKKDEPTFDLQGYGGGLVEGDGAHEEKKKPAAAHPSGLALEGSLASTYDQSGSSGVSGEKIETDAPLADQGGEGSAWAKPLETADENANAVAAASAAPTRRAAGGGGAGGGGGGGDRPPRARPAAPPQKESSGMPMALVAGVVLLVLGGGGFFGWKALQGRGDDTAIEEEVDPPVTIPDIPANLEPRMREVAQLALADWIVAVRDSLPVQQGIALEPDAAWLGSEYMSDASQFGSVAEYWREMSTYVNGILDDEQEIYESFLDARLLDSLQVADPDAEVLKARAAAGFQAGRPERRAVYRQLRTVIEAATGLHEFLVENEDRIEYQPGPERDPVLEAVPETPELGDEMWSRVDDITTALDDLGTMDKVTTQSLMGLAADRFEGIGIR